ncbi:MAG: hypothetical protein EA406_13610, partial [Rhodospirillales bacterium]
QMHGSETDVILGSDVFIPAGRAVGVNGDRALCTLTVGGNAIPLSRFRYAASAPGSAAGAFGDDPARPIGSAAEAAVRAVAGDTVWFADGVYHERLVPANSGTAGNPITFRSSTRLGAWFRGIQAASYSAIIRIDQKDHIVVQGLRVGQTGMETLFNYPVTPHPLDRDAFAAWGCDNIRVEDCAFLYFGRYDAGMASNLFRFSAGGGNECTNVVLRGNTIRYNPATDPHQINISGPFILEGNAAGEGFHSVMQRERVIGADTRLIQRGNVSVNSWGRGGFETNEDHEALIENSTWIGSFQSGRSNTGQAKTTGADLIMRNNYATRCWDGVFASRPHNDYMLTTDQRWYHNTITESPGPSLVLGEWRISGGEAPRYFGCYYLNNWFANVDQHRLGQGLYVYGVHSSVTSYEVGSVQHRADNNLIAGAAASAAIWDNRAGTVHAPPHYHLTATLLAPIDDTVAMWHFHQGFVEAAVSTVVSFDPLTLPSPAIPLARTTTADTDTVIPVTDARMFHEGAGAIFDHIDRGDLIVIGGETRRVVDRDLAANTITVDASLTWAAGAPVNLYWNSAGTVGHHLPVDILASHTVCPPGTLVGFQILSVGGGWTPKFVEWWIGDTIKRTGLTASETLHSEAIHPVNFNETHYPVRARVYCENGEVLWLTTAVAVVAPKPAGKYLSFQLEDYRDHWFAYLKSYRDDPAASDVTTLTHDAKLDRPVWRAGILAGGRGTLNVFPQDWNTDTHPVLWFRYRIKAGVPMTLQLATWEIPHGTWVGPVVAKTADATAVAPVLLIADDEWHEFTLDAGAALAGAWPTASHNLRGFRLRRETVAPDGTDYYALAGLEIRSA